MRDGNREYFFKQLDKHFPTLKEEYIRLYGTNYNLPSPNEAKLMKLFHSICEAHGIWHDNNKIFKYMAQFEEADSGNQLSLF